MNAAEELSTAIGRALPDASVSIDAPPYESGHWWIDIRRGDRKATVEWRPKHGFGVGLGRGEYGQGPDLIVSTVDAATRHVVTYLQAKNTALPTDPTVLVASSDFTWSSAVESHLRDHQILAHAVATFTEASQYILRQAYLVVVVDLAAEPPGDYWNFRDLVTELDSVRVTVAATDHFSAFEDSFELVMHKRIGTAYVASVIEGLVAASKTGRLLDTSSESV